LEGSFPGREKKTSHGTGQEANSKKARRGDARRRKIDDKKL